MSNTSEFTVFTEDLQKKFQDFVEENNHITSTNLAEFYSWCYGALGKDKAPVDEQMAFEFALETDVNEYILKHKIIIDAPGLEELREQAINRAAEDTKQFIKYATSFPLLTDAEAIELIQKIIQDPEDEESKERLIFANAKTIVNYAITRSEKNDLLCLDDIIIEGFQGIWGNLFPENKYRVEDGHFSAFACTCAKHAMYNYTTDNSNLIVIPEYIRRRRDYLGKIRNEVEQSGKDFNTFLARCAVVSEEMRATNTAKHKNGLSQNVLIDYEDVMALITYYDKIHSEDPGAGTHDNIHSLTGVKDTLSDFLTAHPVTVTEGKNGKARELSMKDIKTIFMIFDGFTTKDCDQLLANNRIKNLEEQIKPGNAYNDSGERTYAEVIEDPTAHLYTEEYESIDTLTKIKQLLLEKVNTLSDETASKNSLSDRTIGMLLFGLYSNVEFEQLTGIKVNAEGQPVPNEIYIRRETEFLLRKFAELWNKNTKTSFAEVRVSITDPAEIAAKAKLPIWSIKNEVETRLTPQQKQKFEAAIGGDKTNLYATLQLRWYRLTYLATRGLGDNIPEIKAVRASAKKDLMKLSKIFSEYGIPEPPKNDLLGELILLDNETQEKVLDALPAETLDQLKVLPFYNHKYIALNPAKLVQGYDVGLMTYEEISAFTGVSPSQLTSKIKNIKSLIQDSKEEFRETLYGQ